MSHFTYDFHIHSCLSPCADNDNTPNNLAGMASLAGIKIMALTDHNSCANCPAFMTAAPNYGIIPIPGMELETAEEIHVVCLFPTLDRAMAFDKMVAGRRLPIRNKTQIYGEQWIMNEEDEKIGEDPLLLVVATTISLDEVPAMVESCDGVCYPAHIDRQANGIIAILGDFPPEPFFPAAELHDLSKSEELYNRHKLLAGHSLLTGSDAHRLEDIRDADDFLELDADDSDPDAVRHEVIERIRNGKIGRR